MSNLKVFILCLLLVTCSTGDKTKKGNKYLKYAHDDFEQHDYESALQSIEKAKKLTFNSDLIILNVKILLALKKNQEAVDLIEQKIQEYPFELSFKLFASNLYLKIGDNQKALHHALLAESFSPKNLEIKIQLVKIYLLMPDFDKALLKISSYREFNPKDSEGVILYGLTLLKLKRFKDVISVLDTLPSEETYKVLGFVLLGDAFNGMNNFLKADYFYNLAFKIDGKNWIKEKIADNLFSARSFREASILYEFIYKDNKNIDRIFLKYIDSLLITHQEDIAKEELLKKIKETPYNESIHKKIQQFYVAQNRSDLLFTYLQTHYETIKYYPWAVKIYSKGLIDAGELKQAYQTLEDSYEFLKTLVTKNTLARLDVLSGENKILTDSYDRLKSLISKETQAHFGHSPKRTITQEPTKINIIAPGKVIYALKKRMITVQKNDTLQKISERYFKTTRKWWKIFKLNSKILPSPNSLEAGMSLQIPVK